MIIARFNKNYISLFRRVKFRCELKVQGFKFEIFNTK